MKLVCHSCGTRHSLDDEDRVAGERIEIRCRSCEQVLVHAADPVATTLDSGAPKAVWHAVIGGKQVGPLHEDELVRRRREGDLDEHSLVWREGLADWVTLSTITELEQSSASSRFVLDDLAAVAAPLPTANPYVREGSGLHEMRGIAEAIAPPLPRFVDDLPGSLPAGLAHSMVIVPEVRSEPKSDRRIVFVLSTALASVTLLATLLVIFVIHEDRDPPQASPEPVVQSTRVSYEPLVASEDSQRALASSAPQPEEIIVRTETSTPQARDPVTRPASQVNAERARTTTRTTHRTTTPEPPVAEVATPSMPAVTSTPEPPPPAAECSEVDCVISGYAEACCFRYRPAATTTTPARAAIELPESLDRAALTRGIATIDAKGCSGSSSAPGVVSLAIKVSPEGTVTSVAIKTTPDDALGACVMAAAYKGVFGKTKRGGSFSYPWRF